MPTKKFRTGKKVSNQQQKSGDPKKPQGPDTYGRGWSNRTPNAKLVSHERGAAAMWQSGTL